MSAAVSFLLLNLSQILEYNNHLTADFEESVQSLCRELTILQSLMEYHTKYNHDSDFLKELVKEIRTLVDEAEDAVDTYVLQGAIQRSNLLIEKKAFPFTDFPKKLREVGIEIERLSAKIKAEDFIGVLQSLCQLELPMPAPNTIEEENVVGFDDAAAAVSKLLTQGPEQFATVSIVGMLGLGKTTLAKKVYKDTHVDYEYMIRAFVCVSKEYKRREVFLNILTSFTPISDAVKMKSDEELEKYVCDQLEGKQYLIVLDDIWEVDDWERLKRAFPTNNNRCRVLITTSNGKVAEHANFNMDFHYNLNLLTFDRSRELLRWKVFGQNMCPHELQEYEVEILGRCNGLPLAIVIIAGIICNNKYKVAWWNNVASGVEDYMTSVHEQTTKVMDLMYNHLPAYLKPCFIYLGIFKEDAKVPVWKLLRLWIAEGLIHEVGDINLEDMAEHYLEELVYRNLVMVVERRSNGRIKSCRMHDTLRDYCKYVGSSINMFQEIKEDTMETFQSEAPVLDIYRRLCINNVNINTYLSGNISGKLVRSFLAFTKEDTTVQPTRVSSIPKAFKLLRVLEIQALNFTRFPSNLCDLVLLKYVAISITFAALPQAMSSLWNLQTLIVNTTFHYLEIKADIWSMPHLRHLHTNASTTLCSSDPSKFQNNRKISLVSEHLQTLSTISPESCSKEFFELSSNIKKLGISGPLATLIKVSGDYSSFGSICKLEFLENLKLLNNVKSPLHSLPSAKLFPKKLTKLTLSGTLLDWKEMSTLGKLEKLEVLKVKDNAFQGRLWQTEEGGFLQLKHLYIGRSDLVSWEASVEHFPELRSLELNNCYDLEAFPHGLADIPSLHMVVLHCTNYAVASMARKLQELKVAQAQKDSNSSSFKLSIYPPDH